MIIDDEADICLLMSKYLEHRQFNVHYALTLREGMEMLDTHQTDIVFLDNNLPDGRGWTSAKTILEKFPGIRLYIMSGYQPGLPEGMSPESYTVLNKPISFADLDFLTRNGGDPSRSTA